MPCRVHVHTLFKRVYSSSDSLEQLTALSIFWPVKHLLQDPAEVQWKPAQGEDEDETEHGFGHLPPLQRDTTDFIPLLERR